MQKTLLFFSFLILTSATYAQLSKTRIFPTGIKVSFMSEAPKSEYSNPELTQEINELQTKLEEKLSWFQRRGIQSQLARKEKEFESKEQKFLKEQQDLSPQKIRYQRFIRVVDGIASKKNTSMAIRFYDKDNTLIQTIPIGKTSKLSPRYMFFIDRDSGRNFQGHLDLYQIPPKSYYMQFVSINDKEEVISIANHPDFDEKGDKILISEYNKLSPRTPVMIQIELLGTPEKIFTRMGAFRFV